MKAILSYSVGHPRHLVLAEAAEPFAGPGQVVIKVHACGVNYPDALIIADQYQYRPERPFSPGAEVAGELVALGPDVSNLTVGDSRRRHAQMGRHG